MFAEHGECPYCYRIVIRCKWYDLMRYIVTTVKDLLIRYIVTTVNDPFLTIVKDLSSTLLSLLFTLSFQGNEFSRTVRGGLLDCRVISTDCFVLEELVLLPTPCPLECSHSLIWQWHVEIGLDLDPLTIAAVSSESNGHATCRISLRPHPLASHSVCPHFRMLFESWREEGSYRCPG